MQPIQGVDVPRKNRFFFSYVTVFLLLAAVVAVVFQKQHESAAAISSDIQHHVHVAAYCGILSLAIAALAILTWGIAVWCHEKHRWMLLPVIALLLL